MQLQDEITFRLSTSPTPLVLRTFIKPFSDTYPGSLPQTHSGISNAVKDPLTG